MAPSLLAYLILESWLPFCVLTQTENDVRYQPEDLEAPPVSHEQQAAHRNTNAHIYRVLWKVKSIKQWQQTSPSEKYTQDVQRSQHSGPGEHKRCSSHESICPCSPPTRHVCTVASLLPWFVVVQTSWFCEGPHKHQVQPLPSPSQGSAQHSLTSWDAPTTAEVQQHRQLHTSTHFSMETSKLLLSLREKRF